MTSADILLATLGLVLGGVLKGAVGAGSPILGVPILAILFDVPTAVAIFAIPNLLTNVWQWWIYRKNQISKGFTWAFAAGGGIGAVAGSILLASLRPEVLMASLSGVVILYIAFRLARPHWRLTAAQARALVAPAGLAGGVMQGAGGISAPVSVTFLNAMRLERKQFIATISVYFTAMSVTQIPSLAALGILTGHRAAVSLLAVLPLFAGMPLGAALTRYVSKETFDRLILALLAVIALKLLYDAVF